MELFLEYLGAIAKIENNFAPKFKEKDNWQITCWGKDKINNLAKHVHNYNTTHQDNKASQKMALKTIGSK